MQSASIMGDVAIHPVQSKRDIAQFIDLPYRLYTDDPHWVPPLRAEAKELITPGKNPFFAHADVQLFLARRGKQVVGRISAHIDRLALEQPPEQGMGPGTGNWGMLDAEDEVTAAALIATAEGWLRQQGMTRVLAPLSLSVWDEPGLLVSGFDHPPTIMMGHHPEPMQQWITARGYGEVKRLLTYEVPILDGFPPIVNRVVALGEKNARIRIRPLDRSRFAEDAALIMGLLNDAWSANWGFVPLSPEEIAHVGKKLKPIAFAKLNMIAEVDGEPVAFMLTLPDLNEVTKPMRGKLFPFNWAKLLWWLNHPKARTMRVPLMGVKKELQNSRMASQLAFMMIEYIRRNAVRDFGAQRAEIGWILDDNKGMRTIADAIDGRVNKQYALYAKAL